MVLFRCRFLRVPEQWCRVFYVIFPVPIRLRVPHVQMKLRETAGVRMVEHTWEKRRENKETANLCLTSHFIEAEVIVEHMIDESFPPSAFYIASAKSLKPDKLSRVIIVLCSSGSSLLQFALFSWTCHSSFVLFLLLRADSCCITYQAREFRITL
jgi:hypothetical protein